jgi:plastocyanin
MRLLRTLVALFAVAAAAALPAAAARHDDMKGQLVGTVGPGFTITLQDASGNAVTHLEPGSYSLLVHDLADIHDFHLSGPGVDVTTGVEQTGDQTFDVTFQDGGTYTFVCDPHSTTMNGKFTVGNVAQPPPATTSQTPAPAPKPVVLPKLVGTVGPGFTISLKTTAGAAVKKLRPGSYTITVRDLAAIHNFVLQGPGVSKSTSVAGKGTQTWKLTLKKGTYKFFCAPHRTVMKGSFAVA